MEQSAASVNFYVSLKRTDKTGKTVEATATFIKNNAGHIVDYLQNHVDPYSNTRDQQMPYFKRYIDEDNDSVKFSHVKGNVFNVTYNIKNFSDNLSVDMLINPDRQKPLHLTLLSGSETKAARDADAREAKWIAGIKAGAKYTMPKTGKTQAFYMSNIRADLSIKLKTKTVKISVSLNSGFDMQAYQAVQRGQRAQMPERFYADDAFIAKHASEIIQWYKGQAFGPYYGDYVKIFEIKHVKGNIFQVKYNMNEEMVDIDNLVDPDDDSNYPIELDGHELLVAGRVIRTGKALEKWSGYKAPKAAASPKSPPKAASPKAASAKKAASPKAASAKAASAKAASPKSPKSPRGCTLQTDKKYAARKSPSYPANECCGATMAGNDGKLYKSVASKTGVCRWVLA